MSCSSFRPTLVVALTSLVCSTACENVVGHGRVLRIDDPVQDTGVVPTDGQAAVDTGFDPVDAGNADSRITPKPDLGVPDMGTPDTGLVFDPITRATVGTRCDGPSRKLFLVLSDAPGACAEDGMRLASPPGSPVVIYAELPNPPAVGSSVVSANVCLDANCQMRDLQLELTAGEVGVRIAGTWRVDLDDSRAEGAFDAPWCDYDMAMPGTGVVADGLTLSEVSVYQSVKVNVVENATAVTQRNAPLISSRPGLVRVFVERDNGFTNRDIVARLTLEGPNQTNEVLEETISVTRDSAETVGDSTFNFLLTEDQIKTDTRFHIGLYEPNAECGASTPGDAVFPASGTAELGVEASGTLRIVMVPVRYNADGSGRLPDMGAAQMQRYYDLMYAMFPVSGLELTVREPMDFGGAVQRDGSGWSALLQAIFSLRASDQPPAEVYYYGVFNPASSFSAYCQGSCVAGLGAVPPRNDTYSRGAIGMGFTGQSAAETFTHELGHALGRRHAPCQVGNADPNFPYNGGRLGVYGYDFITNQLKDPDDNRDLMGYCDPTWISDYNYTAMYNRVAFVVPTSPLWSGPRQPWLSLLQTGGTIRFTGQQLLERAPQGPREEAAWILADGNRVAVDVVVYDLDHVADEIMMAPEPPVEAVQLELRGQRINLLP